jgi:hypothetical protein
VFTRETEILDETSPSPIGRGLGRGPDADNNFVFGGGDNLRFNASSNGR